MKATSNAMAMRKSLRRILDVANRSILGRWTSRDEDCQGEMYSIRCEAMAALAATSRNCDRFSSMGAAKAAFLKQATKKHRIRSGRGIPYRNADLECNVDGLAVEFSKWLMKGDKTS